VKAIAIAFAACVCVAVIVVVCATWPPNDPLALASFVVLALTLMVLVWYAYDTNSIARVTRERWSREGVLSTTYSAHFGDRDHPDRFIVISSIGDHDRSGATLGRRRLGLELPLLPP
jgi:hypothetical protein